MTPPPNKTNTGATGADGPAPAGNAANTGTAAPQGTKTGASGATGGAAAGQTPGSNNNTVPPGTKSGNTGGATGGSSRGTGTVPKTNLGTANAAAATAAAAAAATAANSNQRGSLAGPFPVAGSDQVLQITSSMLQQLISSAIAASATGHHKEPPVPKFWESEPAAWFQIFRGHYQPRGLTQVALFNALLPLVPTSAVALCRPYVGSDAPDVFDRVERLLLQRFEMGRMERGKALVECSSLGDRTPEEMLQHMRSLQPGEEEGTIFRYLFISLLPDVVREVVATMESLDDMAKSATSILQSNAAARISALSVQDEPQVSAVRRPSGGRSPRRPRGTASPSRSALCRTHARYGQDAFRCDKPSSCPMHSVIRTPGNGPAGRR